MGLVLGERKFSLVADLTIFVHAGVSVWEVYKGSISIISMFLQLSLDYDGKFASFKNYHLRFINHHILGSTAVKSEYIIIKL